MLVHVLFTALVSGIHSGNLTNSSERVEVRWVGSLEERNLTSATNESDQNQQQHPYGHCYQELFEKHSQTLCGLEFQESMEAIGAQNWCSFDKVLSPYTVLRDCMENLSKLLGCYYPNPSVQDFFLQTHERFFLTCSEDELLLTDAPHNVVVVLTLVPVTLLPLLVYLVVWKSNRRE